MKQRDYLVNKEAVFSLNDLCTIGVALESGIEHGKRGLKKAFEEKAEPYIFDMYFKHISLYVRTWNEMHVDKETRQPVKYFDGLEFDTDKVAEIQEMVDAASNDELAKEEGHVYQLWQDGEITSQKAGELLWQRSLHQAESGLEGVRIPGLVFPHKKQWGDNSYLFCTEADARKIRQAMVEVFVAALLK